MARTKELGPSLIATPTPTGTTSEATIAAAESAARDQRLGFAKWLRVNDAKMAPADRALAARVMATTTGDGTAYDRALASPAVNLLFAEGALYFDPPN